MQGLGISAASVEVATSWRTFFKHLLVLAPSKQGAAGIFAFMAQHPPLQPLGAELAQYFAAVLCPWLSQQVKAGSVQSRQLLERAQAVHFVLKSGALTL